MPWLATHALLAGCADDRALLPVPVTVTPSAAEVQPAEGVTATLTAASMTLTDLRLEAPAETARRGPILPFISPALAHPGHDFAGDVAGELVGTWTLDLLAGPTALGSASCYEGSYATGRVGILPSPSVLLEGTATTLAGEVAFRFTLEPDQEITGIPFAVELDADAPPAGITLGVDLGHALSFVDWATPDGDGDGLLTEADGVLANTVLFGVVATPTFTLALEN